ncbi:MAG: hypothetical protein KQH53_07605 [Desulfarculaceae bacterium]|nr:hypothetical protein [Desulfarculaceae bacterium]
MSARREILVIGGGRFGRLALERLGAKVRALAEPRPGPELQELARRGGVELYREEGVPALRRALASDDPLAWVIPAIPRHLLADWLRAELGAHPQETPLAALPDLPSRIPAPDGGWFLSRADFLCPDDCPEPAGLCTATGQPRGENLFDRLARMTLPGHATAVVRSHQLAPGVGGYRASELLALRDRLAAQGGRWLVATACRCHGVINSLEMDTKDTA